MKLCLFSLSKSRLLLRPFGFSHNLCRAPNQKFLIYRTHNREGRKRRNRHVSMHEDDSDYRWKDEFIITRSVLIDILNVYYHMRRKLYGQIFRERKRKLSTRLGDRFIMRPKSKNKGHHHIKNQWILSQVIGVKVKSVFIRHRTLIETGGKLISR